MYQTLRNLLIACAILSLASCANVEKELQAKKPEWQAALSELKSVQDDLNAKRAELDTLQSPAEGEEAPAAEDLKAQTEELEKAITAAATDLQDKAAELIYQIELWHSDAKKKAKELAMPEEHTLANHYMSDETIVVAHQYIQRQGDYRTAINRMKEALELDPDYDKLKNALAAAEVNQWMTEERLGQVEAGMSEAKVRELIGICNTNYIKQYPENNTVGWFYPREDGGTAAVYFKKDGDKKTVMRTNYDAVKAPTEEGGEEE